ncbi:DNA polymerase V [Enterobacter cloacae complex sp. 358K9]|uniref:DNA polymerase V n=1 Tax=Enterobacter cloacae complex sp. 358K9 TaxID=3395826 RepID=UPI003CF5F555
MDRRFYVRHYEIDSAWRASIKREPNGRQTVTTEAFVSQLALINFHWSCRQANQWIETYVTVFKDISTQGGENRTFMLFNPNGGR